MDTPVDVIYNQDCIEGMRQLPDDFVHLVVADPPYNLEKDFGNWKEPERKDEWLPWCKEWISEAKRILVSGGNIFVYGIHHHLCWLQCYMYEIGFTYRRQIIWHYENGFAGYNKRSLAAHYEPILWFSKGNNYTYHPIREPYKSKERLKHKIIKNGKQRKPHPEGRLAGDVWKFPTLAGRRFREEKVDHPTQKSLSLSERIIKHFSNKNDVVLVPFAGSGTECLAALMHNRRYIGYELNDRYINIAQKRILDWETKEPQLVLRVPLTCP